MIKRFKAALKAMVNFGDHVSSPINYRYQGATYLAGAFCHNRRQKIISNAKRILTKYRSTNKFEAIAVCGYSGLGLGTVISWEMDIPLIVVRKAESHDTNLVFGCPDIKSYIIIDDIIDTGQTIRHIHQQVAKFTGTAASSFACEPDWNIAYKTSASLLGVFCYDTARRIMPDVHATGGANRWKYPGNVDLLATVPIWDLDP